jgi:hypothetical protein
VTIAYGSSNQRWFTLCSRLIRRVDRFEPVFVGFRRFAFLVEAPRR